MIGQGPTESALLPALPPLVRPPALPSLRLVAARTRWVSIVGAVLVLVLFVAAGAPVVAGALGRDQIACVSEGRSTAAERLAAGHRLVPLVRCAPTVRMPRPLPRTRQIATRGLPPPRAPTA